jgi:hypothetical protein
MEVLTQAQSLVVENAFTIGVCLFLLVLLAGLVWFSMSSNKLKSEVLENKARVNDASTESPQIPPQEYVEEMARRASSEEQADQGNYTTGDNTTE